MSTERELRQAFRAHADSIVPPPAVDAAVAAMYRGHAMGRKGATRMKMRKRLSRAAIAALVIAVLSGFAYAGGKLLFEQEKGHVGMAYRAVETFAIPEETLDRIRGHLNAVKEQIEPGEQAVVYLQDMKIVVPFGLDPILGVAKPDPVTSLKAWQAALADSVADARLPGELPDGEYRFAEGFEGYPFGSALGLAAMELVPELAEESEATGQAAVWREIASGDAPISGYTTTYRNGEHAIYYTVEAVTEPIRLEAMMGKSAALEQVQVNGDEAAYTRNESFLYTDSGLYQEIAWLTEREGRTIIHRIGTDSNLVTKEQLLEAASFM